MHPNQEIKFNDWYMKTDPPIRVTVNFEGRNVPLESPNENDSLEEMFVKKPVKRGYNIKKFEYDNLKLETES